jgi:lantibiotic modifying enzyme
MSSLATRKVEYIETSKRIGRRIAEEAIWHDDRCNWVGAEPIERQNGMHRSTMTYRTLGPELYSGTSGIALFLAELYALTNDSSVRKAALGAIRQAFSRLDSIPPASRPGLFSGWTGIAFAAVRVAHILDEKPLLDQARDLLQRTLEEQHGLKDFDLISGRAGTIAALIVLHHILNDSSLLDLAARLGDELVDAADKSDFGYSWELTGVKTHHNLTGFSHGAAGAAYSLLELYESTGVREYRDAALRAFEYERYWFNADQENWPDFRKDFSLSRGKSRRFPCLAFWCHGAPGIALSRLRACEILGDEKCAIEAMIALKTTRASIDTALSTSTGNYSLCHGFAGNAEALLYGVRVHGDDFAEGAATVFEAADAAIERFSSSGSAWPCGTHTGETHGLMLGLAGIGHHFLRLYEPSTPAIAILRKQDWLKPVSAIRMGRFTRYS